MKRLIPIFFILLAIACRKEIKMPGWEGQWLAPLAYSDMGINDLIPDSLLEVNPDSSLILVFNEVLYSAGIDSVLPLPDSVFSDTFFSPIPINVPPASTFYNETIENNMSLDGPELTRVILKQGSLQYSISNRIPDFVNVSYEITCATKFSLPVIVNFTVPPGTIANPTVVQGTYDLSNCDFDLRGPALNDFNIIVTNLKLTSTNGASINAFNKVFFDSKFINLVAEYAKGYFGQQTFAVPYQTQAFTFMQNLQPALLDLDSITAKVYLSNGLGADARIQIDTVLGNNTYHNTAVLLSHPQFGNPININRATDLGYAAQPYEYTFNLTQFNSNIESFVENLPGEIGYAANVEINPLGNISNHTDFVRGNSKVEVGLNMRIPLNVAASGISLNDTIPINMDEMDGNGHFNSMLFRLITENGFPLEATVNIYMLDVNNMSIGTLASGLTVSAGTLNINNVVTAPSSEIKEVLADASKMEKLYRAKNLRIQVNFQTAGTGKVEFYNHYRFKSKLIVDASYLSQE